VRGGWKLPNSADFWRSIAFYNFVQVPVGNGEHRKPTGAEFASGPRPFRAVMNALKPERIWVCGKRLWTQMDGTEHELHADVQGYDLPGGGIAWSLATGIAWSLATNHPSSPGFSWERTHPLIKAFIADPKEAAHALAEGTVAPA
jgi:hypothetical protein